MCILKDVQVPATPCLQYLSGDLYLVLLIVSSSVSPISTNATVDKRGLFMNCGNETIVGHVIKVSLRHDRVSPAATQQHHLCFFVIFA